MHRVGGHHAGGALRWAALTHHRRWGGACNSLIHPSRDFLSAPKSVLGPKMS